MLTWTVPSTNTTWICSTLEGPGHGGQVMVSNSYLDGSYTELNPNIPQNEEGFKHLCKIFSFLEESLLTHAWNTRIHPRRWRIMPFLTAGAVLIIRWLLLHSYRWYEGETGPLMAGWLSPSWTQSTMGRSFQSFYLNGGDPQPNHHRTQNRRRIGPSLKVLDGNQSCRRNRYLTTKQLCFVCSILDEAIEDQKSKQKLVKVLLKKQLNQFTLSDCSYS